MIIVFDLDDTLYDEQSFVYSGFTEVAKWISMFSNSSSVEIFDHMVKELSIKGRGKIFDNVLEKYLQKTPKNIQKCLSVYRLHKPAIKLDSKVVDLLLELGKNHKLYIVTDGNKLVQSNKIKSLEVEKYIEKAFITYRYGLIASKPSLKCFEIIKNKEKVDWHDIVYIGDNPKKDFVNLNKVNAITIRVLQGDFALVEASKGYDAKYKIDKLTDLKKIIKNIYENRKL
jgi:putative hydrolase of the HAD superfamily